MVLNISRICLIAATVLLVFGFVATDAQAGGHRTVRTAGDLFYNYYVPASPGGATMAEMYPCPRPVPPWVGYTYITYQPLLPQEFLYKHKRSYKRIHPCGGSTRTRVIWY